MTENITVIVFSKNRPMQLYALLESIGLNTNFVSKNINILYKADHNFIWPMEQVKQAFPTVLFHPEFDFTAQVTSLVNEAKGDYIIFFTDDDVFKDKVDMTHATKFLEMNSHVFCFSLRLGKHLDFCYSTQSRQNVPSGITKEPFFIWSWKGTDWDWNYPLSVDGHLFRKKEMLTVLGQIQNWRSPNTFEGQMSHLHPTIPHPQMACFTSSKVFNIPHNRVQNEVQNVFGGGSEDELLTLWNQGKKINIKTFQGIKNKSAHQLVPLSLVDRLEIAK
jgi:hypothetical protein